MTATSRVAVGSDIRGFDVNAIVSAEQAALMVSKGFKFCLRYLPRTLPGHTTDLSKAELEQLLAAGLLVGAVQHVESESSWEPSESKGRLYGSVAGTMAVGLGLQGTTVWCDLEGVAPGTDPEVVIAYCRAWFEQVNQAGCEPGLYVGWHCGLTPTQLYDLPFTRYWLSYNLDSDEAPAKRGGCMKQHEAKLGDDPVGLGIDTDTVRADALGGLPTMLGHAVVLA